MLSGMAEAAGEAGLVEALAASGGDEGAGPGEPGESDGGVPERKAPARPSSRFLTITVVLATLVAAVGGFLLNRAAAFDSDDADQAQQLSLQASATQTSAYQRAETDYSQYVSVQVLQAKAAQEMLEAAYPQPNASNWADLYTASTAQAAQAAKNLPVDLKPNLANGDPDPNFPYDLFDKRASQGIYLQARSDGYNYAANRWSALESSYTAIVTMIAVSLFLFGSAFVLYGRNRLLFSFIAIVLVATGLLWEGTLFATQEPAVPSVAAAKDYANGVVAMGVNNYGAAIKDMTLAIKARPDYALAYSERALAESDLGSEQLGSGFVSNLSPYWAKRFAADSKEAYRLGDDEAGQVVDLGWAYYYLWLIDGARGKPPGQAETLERQGVQLDPSFPIDWMNLGLIELAEGDYRAATKAYLTAATHMLFTCSNSQVLNTCTTPQPGTNYDVQEGWLAGGMQDLKSLAASNAATHSPALLSAVRNIEGILTGSLANDKVVTGPSRLGFKLSRLSAAINPDELELQVPIPHGISLTRMVDNPVTVIWYQRSSGATEWNGIADTACWQDASQDCDDYDSQANALDFDTQFLQSDGDCFTDLVYRAEIYIGGSLAGSVELGPRDDHLTTNLQPALASSMNVGICVPSTWYQQPTEDADVVVYGTTERISGPLSTAELSYGSRGGSQGVYLLRLYPLRTDIDKQHELESTVEQMAKNTVRLLNGHGLPTDLSETGPYQTYPSNDLTDMVAAGYGSSSTGISALVGAGIISSGTGASSAASQDKAVASDVSDDGAIAVWVVYGTYSSGFWTGQHALGLQVFSSWSLLGDG
ncbi:MAG: tetratricopeptide repeat protein [Acidimicrobiales bacterium]|jgi:tetratricopeptide (TPR) repeat protein